MNLNFSFDSPNQVWRYFDPKNLQDSQGNSAPMLQTALKIIMPLVVLGQGNSASLFVEWEKDHSAIDGSEAAWLTLNHVPDGKDAELAPSHLAGTVVRAYGTMSFRCDLFHQKHIDGHDIWSVDEAALTKILTAALTYHVPPVRKAATALIFRRYASGHQIRPLIWDADCGFHKLQSDHTLAELLSRV